MSKKELIECMPESKDAQKAIVSAVNEIVDSMIRVQSEKELIGTIKETTEEKYSVSGKYVESLAKLRYDKLYNDSKAIKKILTDNERLEEFNTHIDK